MILMTQEKLLDKLISEAIKTHIEAAELPDFERIWEKIHWEIKKRQRKAILFKSFILVAVFLLFIGSLAAINPEPVRALGIKVWYGFKTIFCGHTATIHMSYTGNLGTNPPEQPQLIIKPSNNLAQLASKSPFPIKAPLYLPPGSELIKVKIIPLNSTNAIVEIHYSLHGQPFILSQWNGENQGVGYGYDTDDTVVSDVMIRNCPAKLFYRKKDNYTQLTWGEDQINYQIGGVINPDEAKRIASSLTVLKK